MVTSSRIAVALAVLSAAASVVACSSGTSEPPPKEAPDVSTGPVAGFTRDDESRLEFENVYLGVSCVGRGNYVGCDRVCLFVLTRKGDPDHLLAAFGGLEVRLDRVSTTPSSFEACVRRDGLLHQGPLAVEADENERWFGSPPVSVELDLTALFLPERRYVEQHLPKVRLGAGYG